MMIVLTLTHSINVRYTLSKADKVSLRLYNLTGKLQQSTVNGRQESGDYTVRMQAPAAAGAYVLVFQAGSNCQKRMISLVR
jgi:hypothetical protein